LPNQWLLALEIPHCSKSYAYCHILAFYHEEGYENQVPILALTISGGHTQIVEVKDYFDLTIIEKQQMMP
jgi:N6-L-threonylcarbamoyladenine synthase